MLAVPVINMQGQAAGEVQIDPAVLGGEVRTQLMKQAVVAYLDHQRQDGARTKGRGDVEGSTRKIYRQKGTGRARMGNLRTPIRRGGGRTFAKRGPTRRLVLPRKMRRAARNSALLAKIQADGVVVVDDLACSVPKTRALADFVRKIGAETGCLLATDEYDRNVFLSGRNLARIDVRAFKDVSAYEVLRWKKLVIAKPAFEKLAAGQA